MSQQLFQEHCGYVTQKADLIPGLTVRQTLQYAANMTISMQVGVLGFVLPFMWEVVVSCERLLDCEYLSPIAKYLLLVIIDLMSKIRPVVLLWHHCIFDRISLAIKALGSQDGYLK